MSLWILQGKRKKRTVNCNGICIFTILFFLLIWWICSSFSWIPSTECAIIECLYERFDASQSSTYVQTRSTSMFNESYGLSDYVWGPIGNETVTVGNLTVHNQTLGFANHSTIDISYDQDGLKGHSVGILGLAFPGNKTQYPPFILNLINQRLISQPIFSLYFGPYDEPGYSGELMLGGADSSKYVGELAYIPVVPQSSQNGSSSSSAYGYWAVNCTGIAIPQAGLNILFSGTAPQRLILVTSNTVTLAPASIAESIVMAVTGISNSSSLTYDKYNGVYDIPCSLVEAKDQYISFSTAAGAATGEITKQNISVPISDLVYSYTSISTPSPTDSQCYFGISPIDNDDGVWYLGLSVLRSLYVSYDVGNHRIGMAPVVRPSPSSTSSTALPTSILAESKSAVSFAILDFNVHVFVSAVVLLLCYFIF